MATKHALTEGVSYMTVRKQRFWFDILFSSVIALLLSCSLYAASVEQPWQMYKSQDDMSLQQYALTDPVAAGEPLTFITQVKLNLSGDSSSLFGSSDSIPEQVVLAGVSIAPGEKPTALAVVWQLDASGWFPTWKLYLISDAGLLNSTDQQLKLDADDLPFDGDEYRTLFSLDPASGTLSIRVINARNNKVVYTGNTQVQPIASTLYPGVGTLSTDRNTPTQIDIHELKVQEGFIPVGANVRIMARISGTNFLAAMSSLDRRDEWVLDVALPQLPLEHPLQVAFDNGSKQTVFVELQGVTGNRQIEVDSKTAPAGQLDMVLNYMMGGMPWEISRVPIKIGTAGAVIQDVQLGTNDQGQLALLGTVQVTSDGPLPAFHVLLDYELHTPGAINPLYSQWKKQIGQTRVYVDTITDAKELPFQIPLQAVASLAEDNELFFKVACTSDLGLPFFTAGLDRFVVGERPVAFPKVGPYTVLRGDFHTHSTESDGQLSPADRVWETYMYGYDILALTDHRTMAGYDGGRYMADLLGLIYVRGFETGINSQEHLVVLGVDEDYKLRDEHQWARNPNEARVYYQDQVREVINHGGFIIYAHPGGTWLPPGPYSSPEGLVGWTDAIEWMIKQGYLHGVESRGVYAADRRNAPYRWALQYGLTLFDVTDIHGARDFTAANQAPLTLVLVEEASAEGVLDALRAGRTLIYRNDVLRGTATWIQPLLDAVLDIKLIERDGELAIQITNKGPLPLYGWATPAGGDQRTFWLTPYGTVFIACPANAESVSIRWGNVQSGPDQPHHSVFSLK